MAGTVEGAALNLNEEYVWSVCARTCISERVQRVIFLEYYPFFLWFEIFLFPPSQDAESQWNLRHNFFQRSKPVKSNCDIILFAILHHSLIDLEL